MDDIEFETLLEGFIPLWRGGKNTAEIAETLGTTEAKIAEVLNNFSDAMYYGKQEIEEVS